MINTSPVGSERIRAASNGRPGGRNSVVSTYVVPKMIGVSAASIPIRRCAGPSSLLGRGRALGRHADSFVGLRGNDQMTGRGGTDPAFAVAEMIRARYPDCRSDRSMIIAWQAVATVLRPWAHCR